MTTKPLPQHVDVVVVGAGISGLTCAFDLAAAGHRVAVCDAADTPGGAIAPLQLTETGASHPPLALDAGAEALLNRRPEAVQLAHDVGLADDLCYPHTTQALLLNDGELVSVPKHTMMGVPSASTDLTEVLTAEEISQQAILSATSAPPQTDDIDIHSFISVRSSSVVADRIVEPILGGVYAGHANQLSLRAAMPGVWRAVQRPGSLNDQLQPLVQAVSDMPVFAGIRGGIHRLVTALVDRIEQAGSSVHCGTAVHQLTSTTTGWQVDTTAGNITSDQVVLATPTGVSADLLRTTVPAAAAVLADIPAASIAVVTAVLPTGQQLPQEYSGMLVPPVEGRLIKAATFSSSKWRWVMEASDGHPVVRMSVGRLGEDRPLDLPDDSLIRAACADLADILGQPISPVSSAVTRWRHALPQYTVGHIDRVAAIDAAMAAHPTLFYTHASLDGVGIAACVARARATAAQLTTERPAHVG